MLLHIRIFFGLKVTLNWISRFHDPILLIMPNILSICDILHIFDVSLLNFLTDLLLLLSALTIRVHTIISLVQKLIYHLVVHEVFCFVVSCPIDIKLLLIIHCIVIRHF